MWGFFGGNAAPRKDAPKSAILQLRGQLEMLSKREKHLMIQMDEQDALARKNVNTNKTAAKAALRRKKMFEESLETTNSQITTLERQIYSIEAANINKETLDAMQNASKAMKQIHGKITVDGVEDIMSELEQQHDVAHEISTALSQGVGNSGIADEDLEDELEALQQEELENKMLQTGAMPANRLPSAPESAIKGKAPTRVQQQEEDDEEEELRRLQAEMAM